MLDKSEFLHAKILVVDDQEANVILLVRMLSGAGYDSVTSIMDPSLVFGLHQKEHYDLILLDLQMPVIDGFQVMEQLKNFAPEGYLPVLVITAQPGFKLRALQAGAKDFISKPFELAEVLARVHNILEVRLLHNKLTQYNDFLEKQIQERTADLQNSYLETIFAMTRAAEYKDEDIGDHVLRISYFCHELSRMLGMDDDFVDRIFFSSPMHDIGKIGIPDHVLLKQSELNSEEWQVMKGHSLMGFKILGNSKSEYLKLGAEIALNHHERWDGKGYPDGKAGEEIPLAARIMNICDIYDALRSKRPYKPAFDHSKTMNIITYGDGRTMPEHFDPVILSMFKQNHQSMREIFETYTPLNL